MTDKELAEFCALSCNYSTFTVGELECLEEYRDGIQYLAIRGTEASRFFSGLGFMDVLRDMRVFPWHDEHLGWCHSGFLKGALRVIDTLKPVKSSKIIITGHSLGAAVGQLVALKLAMQGYQVSFVGFGMPRCFVGKPKQAVKDCAALFGFKHYRFRSDIVPTIPRRWFLKYRHCMQWEQISYHYRERNWHDHNLPLYIRSA